MDKESKSSSSSLSGNGLMAVLLVVAGVFLVREVPLETTRQPVNEVRLSQQQDVQDIDARLWQDPYAAVAKARAEAAKRDPKNAASFDADRTLQLKNGITQKVKAHKHVEILVVALLAGPYSENVESRRRARYAVVSALNASRMQPVDTEHLGYFLQDPKKSNETELATARKVPLPIPYEWFEPMTDSGRKSPEKSLQSHVLVIWLPSESFDTEPFAQMSLLIDSLGRPPVTWRILGPIGSDGLRAMVRETMQVNYIAFENLKQAHFYSLYATVPDEILLRSRNTTETSQDLSKYLNDKGVRLIRTIGDDGKLADALITELALRRLKPARGQGRRTTGDACPARGDSDAHSLMRIAVVAEWDTLYGRSLRRQFLARPDEEGYCVDPYIYVRGLDGQLPATADGAPAAASGDKLRAGDKEAQRRKDGTFVEIAEGQSQFDYLRRLAVQMREKEELVRRTTGGEGYRAIGVLGNDVHDKLLVMQALRPEFPNAIFFTTDMDARYLHPREQAWTRNLIVASSFGLRLTDTLQGGAPPFRDGYQTSAFLSTRLALDDARRASLAANDTAGGKAHRTTTGAVNDWLDKPRIFEIGRTGAFDFSGRAYGVLPAPVQGGGSRPELLDYVDVHPEGSPPYPSPGRAIMFLVFSVMLLAMWLPFFALNLEFGKPPRRAPGKPGTGLRTRHRVLLMVLLQTSVSLLLAFQWEDLAGRLTENGKPLTAMEGISLWPTELIRLYLLVVCGYLVVRAWRMLSHNLNEISHEFGTGDAREVMTKAQEKIDKHKPMRDRFLRMISMGIVDPTWASASAAMHTDVEVAELGMQPDAIDFWSQHIVQNRLSARLVRTTACVAIAALVSLFLAWAIGEYRFVPARGELSEIVHDSLRIPALLMIYFLIFFVVDATVLSVCFVRGLLRLRREKEDRTEKGRGGTNWPEITLATFRRELDLPKGYIGNWIDLKFIALRTDAVTGLIYYPFIVISLWLLSKSTVFDHWTLSIGGLAVALIGAGVAFGLAVALRTAAEASRKHALERIQDALMRMNKRHVAIVVVPSVEQLELLRSRIEHLQEGAFAPYWQQPLLKAVLLPFAAVGSTTLLDYMALVNL